MHVNLRDFPPLASVHRPDLRPEQLAEWEKLFSAGTQAQAAGKFAEALGDFRQAAEIDGGFAELAFQRARCEMELKQDAAAESDFRRARFGHTSFSRRLAHQRNHPPNGEGEGNSGD